MILSTTGQVSGLFRWPECKFLHSQRVSLPENHTQNTLTKFQLHHNYHSFHILYSRSINSEQLRPCLVKTVQVNETGFQSQCDQIVPILLAQIFVGKRDCSHRIILCQIERAQCSVCTQAGLWRLLAKRPHHSFGITWSRCEHRSIVSPIARPNNTTVDAIFLVGRRDQFKITCSLVRIGSCVIFEDTPTTITTNGQQVFAVWRKFHLCHCQLVAS